MNKMNKYIKKLLGILFIAIIYLPVVCYVIYLKIKAMYRFPLLRPLIFDYKRWKYVIRDLRHKYSFVFTNKQKTKRDNDSLEEIKINILKDLQSIECWSDNRIKPDCNIESHNKIRFGKTCHTGYFTFSTSFLLIEFFYKKNAEKAIFIYEETYKKLLNNEQLNEQLSQ